MLSCNIDNYLIKPQNERHIIKLNIGSSDLLTLSNIILYKLPRFNKFQ